MRNFSRNFSSIAGVAAMLFFSTLANAQEYKIKLKRPSTVGEQFTLSVTVKFKQDVTATANGQEQKQSTSFVAECHGAVKVLAINEKTGAATKISCKVDKFTKDGQEFLPAGTEITAEKTASQPSFTVDGKDLDDGEKVSVLSQVFEIPSSDDTSNDDEVMGTDQPQKVGGTWPISKELIAKEMAKEQLPVTADNIKGDVTLVEVKKVNDVDSMTLKTVISAEVADAPAGVGPPITALKMHAEETGVLPVDPSLQGTSTNGKMTMDITVDQGAAGKQQIHVDREKSETHEVIK